MIDLSDAARARIGRSMSAGAIVLVVVGIAWIVLAGSGDAIVESFVAHNAVSAVAAALVAWVVLPNQARNGAVWVLVWVAVFSALMVASNALAEYLFDRTGTVYGPGLTSSDVSTEIAMALWFANWTWAPSLFPLVTFGLLLFPDGRLRSASDKRIAMLAAVGLSTLVLMLIWLYRPGGETEYESDVVFPVPGIGLLVMLVAVAFTVTSFVRRYRASSGTERLQFKWIAASAAVLGVTAVIGIPYDGLGPGMGRGLTGYPMLIGAAMFFVAYGVAIGRYRLYDIDVIISRSLVFVLLVGFITVVYAAVVVGISSLVGGSSVGWSIAATALVAVVFEPVRDRVQRWVNGLVLGRRATPYEVLADLTGRLTATEREEGLLNRMAQRLAEGTGADRAIVWTPEESGFAPAAFEPQSDPLGSVASLDLMPGSVVPITHEDVILGALSVESRRGDALTPTEQRLVEDLAGSAGLWMRRLRLDQALEQKAAELEESRRRLVDAQDVERRRLERELNEGAQQRVVALKVQLGLAEQQARREGAESAATLIAQMAGETQDAIDQIRALANGIYPPLLEAEGLAAAVTSLAEVAPVEVRIDVDISRRYPLPAEAAAYFCISEALTNAVKHGQAPIHIKLSDATGELTFSMSDSGPGFDLTKAKRGSGLNNMSDRLDALDGGITIDTRPGGRTTITGRLPRTSVEAMA